MHGKTPRELFRQEHKSLLKEGERWIKDTSNSCMIVATLIAKTVFAAVFTASLSYQMQWHYSPQSLFPSMLFEIGNNLLQCIVPYALKQVSLCRAKDRRMQV